MFNRKDKISVFRYLEQILNRPDKKGKWIDRLNPWVSLIGMIISLFFAGWAIWLAIQAQGQSQRIENMQDVIRELKSSNKNLQALITKTNETYERSGNQLDSLSKVSAKLENVASAQEKTATALASIALTEEVNTAPKILAMKGRVLLYSAWNFEAIFEVVNVGFRTATDIRVDLHAVVDTGKGYKPIFGGNDKYVISSLEPRVRGSEASLQLASSVAVDKIGLALYNFKIVIKYKDEKTGKELPPYVEHFYLDTDEFLIVKAKINASVKAKETLDKYFPTYPKGKN